ncbi:enolase C-terminal domain-like protein [Candidatus Latescibacterota bacterium]
MKISDIEVIRFRGISRTTSDSEGHGHPGDEHETAISLTRIGTDDGAEGYCLGGSAGIMGGVVRQAIIGEDPLFREKIWQKLHKWQRLHKGSLSDGVLATVDMALWDLAGRYLGQPVYKLLGGYRTKVPAYASTMCGDELPGGLDTPEAYGEFALKCKARGYPAFKLHTWMPPIAWAPDPKMDVAACRAVREAVGDEMRLMLDCYHHYSREEALFIGRELEKLDYYWFEEPMMEESTSSYVWLAEQLDIPVLGPETAEGKMFTRAEWIVRGADRTDRPGR